MASNAQQIKELSAAIALLKASSADVVTSLAEISKNFGETIKPAKALGKELDRISGTLQDTVDYNDKIEDQLRDMHRASKELSRIKWLDGVTSEQAHRALTNQLEAMKKIKAATVENSSANEKLTRQMALLEQQLQGVDQASKQALSTKQAEELQAVMEALSNDTKEFGKNLDSIDFRRPQAKLTGFGTAMSGVFGGVLGSMKIMDSYGFKNLTTALHKMKREALDVKKNMEKGGHGYDTGKDVERMFGSRDKNGKLIAPSGSQLENYNKMVAGKQAEKGAFQNLADHSLRRLMENRVGAGKGQTLTKMFAQGGGSITEGIGMSSIMGLTKFMGPIGVAITAIGGLLAAFGAVGARRKDTYDALGKGGLLGTGVTPRDAYNKIQKQLNHSSIDPTEGGFEKSVMGLNYDKNMATVKAMVEGGIGLSALGNKNAFEELGNGRSTNMMGGIMRNANLFGHNLGMSQEDSVALTSKAIGDFNLSFGETEDLFININRGVTAAGVSTTKYLGIIDDISGQFSRFNKTMGDTVLIIQAMGRSGKYTADYIAEMVNSLMGKEKSDEQRALGYSLMTQGNRKGILKGRETAVSEKGKELDDLLGTDATGRLPSEMSPNELSDFIDKNHKNTKVGQVATQYNQLRLRADSTRGAVALGGNKGAMALAAIDANMGDDRQSRAAVHMSLLDTTIKNSGVPGSKNMDAMSLLDPKKSAQLMQSMGMAKLAQLMGIDPKTLGAALPDALRQAAGSFRDNKIAEYMAGDTSDTTEEKKRENATKKVNEKYGATAEDTLKNKEFQEQRKSGAWDFKMAGLITDKQRTAEEEKARENYKVILDPLNFIKNTLKVMLDKIIEMLTVVVDWFNKTFFESDTETSRKNMSEMKQQDWSVEGITKLVDQINKSNADPKEKEIWKSFLAGFKEDKMSTEAKEALQKKQLGKTVDWNELAHADFAQKKLVQTLKEKGLKSKSTTTGLELTEEERQREAKEREKSKEKPEETVVGAGSSAIKLNTRAWSELIKGTLKNSKGEDYGLRDTSEAGVEGSKKEIGDIISKYQSLLSDTTKTKEEKEAGRSAAVQSIITIFGVDASQVFSLVPSLKKSGEGAKAPKKDVTGK